MLYILVHQFVASVLWSENQPYLRLFRIHKYFKQFRYLVSILHLTKIPCTLKNIYIFFPYEDLSLNITNNALPYAFQSPTSLFIIGLDNKSRMLSFHKGANLIFRFLLDFVLALYCIVFYGGSNALIDLEKFSNIFRNRFALKFLKLLSFRRVEFDVRWEGRIKNFSSYLRPFFFVGDFGFLLQLGFHTMLSMLIKYRIINFSKISG